MTISPKILIADDSAVAAAMLGSMLKARDYQVVRAADGIEAVQMVYSESPDLVLLDIFMPRMNGYQVCRLLKDDPAVASIPVIIMTGSDSRSAEFWSLQTGADAFMVKGFQSAELLGTVERLLAALVPRAPLTVGAPPPEEILSKVSALMDRELYTTTVERMELKTILQNLTDGIMTLDMQRLVASANRALGQMLGVNQLEILGRPCCEALGVEAGTEVLELFERALFSEEGQNASPECDSYLRDITGRATPVAINVALLHDHLGKTVGCVCLFQDITRRKEVEALNQLKNDLTDMIVHDLRTPLTSFLSGLETVEVLGELSPDQQECLNISMSGGQVLLGMINDLLDISKMEAGSLQLDRSPVNLEHIITNALRQTGSIATFKSVDLKTEVSPRTPHIVADEDKLLRVLVNLMSNAIKFTPAGGAVTVSAGPSASGDECLVEVRDTGEGIPADSFDRIFEKFGQVDSRKGGSRMSSGLGLTFCKLAVEAHGGRIWVESELGAGSNFMFTVPRAPGRPELQAVVTA